MPVNPYATATAAAPASDQTQGKNQLLYPLDDADKSWNNALLDSGYNIYRANPFVQSLQRAGRGNRVTYLLDKSAQGGQAEAAPGVDVGGDFGSYLRNQIQGGNAYYNLGRGASELKGGIQNVRGMQDAIAGGHLDASQANPYTQLLGDELGSGSGQGTATAMSYLRSPLMGTSLGRSYSSMLSDIVGSANRALAQDPNAAAPNSNKDIWSYIFGGSQGLF